MSTIKPQFDYKSIIEGCGIQDVNIKNALDDNNESKIHFQEQFNTLKSLSKEANQKNETLTKLKLDFDKNLHKLNKTSGKLSLLNKEQTIVQDEISRLNRNLQQKSDAFVKKMTDMDNELTALYAQFEGETLMNLISDSNSELLAIQDTKAQLESVYENLKHSLIDLSAYDRPKILQNILGNVTENKNIDEINMKLAIKKRNVQFLTAECNKKLQQLENYEK